MQFATLEELFFHPSFLSILLTILVTIANIVVGVSILPEDKRQKGYRLHRYVFFGVVVCYSFFLIVNHKLIGNTVFNYLVLIYFISVIPLSRKWNVTFHAILSSIGLVLLLLVATFGVL